MTAGLCAQENLTSAMLLLAKLLLVPAFVAGVTACGRRWGERVGGVLTALPMVAGPALVFYALEQGEPFASDAASSAHVDR